MFNLFLEVLWASGCFMRCHNGIYLGSHDAGDEYILQMNVLVARMHSARMAIKVLPNLPQCDSLPQCDFDEVKNSTR